MSHIENNQKQILNRTKRIRGQLDGVIKMIELNDDCTKILNTIAACRGAINGLIAEILEGHINEHVISVNQATSEQLTAAEDLIYIIKKYLK